MRLPVVMPQTAPAKHATVAEAVIGSLIGRPGLDLTLVDRLELIDAQSTDRMTLDGITVPAAVLNWAPAEETWDALVAIDFRGSRTAHKFDVQAPSQGSSPRRLFLFDLREFESVGLDHLVAELNRLKDSLAVKTFSLGLPSGEKPMPGDAAKTATASVRLPVASKATPPNIPNDSSSVTSETNLKELESNSASVGDEPKTFTASSMVKPGDFPADSNKNSNQAADPLDDLIDQLDDLDV